MLRTNVTDWSPDELWRTYTQLADVEAAFRIQTSELAIRPVWHQRAERVQAHILVCFLAYVLLPQRLRVSLPVARNAEV